MKRVVAEVSSTAILHNLELVKRCAHGGRICAVVKANAYGHGGINVALLLEKSGVDFFAVATVEEGIELRCAGIKSGILILGYVPLDALSDMVRYDLTWTLTSLRYARELAVECKRKNVRVPVHIKVDTGMHRLGFDFSDFESIFEVCTYPCYEICGIFSHFSSSDDPLEVRFTDLQYRRLKGVCDALSNSDVNISIRHIANSAAIGGGKYSMDMVRAGIMLYGYGKEGLIPAMSLKSQVVSLRKVKRGERVGYTSRFAVKRDSLIATVPIGYADGVRRDLAGCGVTLLVGDSAARVVGNVCMDYLMLDVTDIPLDSENVPVNVFGNIKEHTAEDLARKLGTVPYEILTSLTSRVERVMTV